MGVWVSGGWGGGGGVAGCQGALPSGVASFQDVYYFLLYICVTDLDHLIYEYIPILC